MMAGVKDRNGRVAVTRPNWSQPVKVDYSFKTSIFKARDGHEHRESIRVQPRVSIQFGALLTRAELARHTEDLSQQQDSPFILPLQWLSATLDGDHSAGVNSLTVANAPGWFAPGARVVVETDTSEDTFTLVDVTGNTAVLDTALPRDLPSGAKVRFAVACRAQESVDFTAETAVLWRGAVRYDVVPGEQQPPYRKVGIFGYAYREMLLDRPNWETQPRIRFLGERDVFDPGLGRVDVFAPEDTGRVRVKYGFRAFSATERDQLVSFFLRHKGRRTAFWVPLWSRAVIPSAQTLPAADTFQVGGADFRAAYAGSVTYNTLIAFWPDGTYQINKVTSIDGTADSTVVCADVWQQPIVPDTRLYWLLLARFDSDTLTVRHHVEGVADVDFSIVSTRSDEPLAGAFPVEFDALLGDFNSVYKSGLVPVNYNSSALGRVIDLAEYGVPDEEISAGKVAVAAMFQADYYYDGQLSDSTGRLWVQFHASRPGNIFDSELSALPGEQKRAEVSGTPHFDLSLGPVTVPPGTKFLQISALYEKFTKTTLDTHFAGFALLRKP